MPRDPHRVAIADRVRLQHMLDAALDAVRFMDNRSRADLDTDSLLVRGVMHAIQEIGEAAARISDQGRARVPDIPWTKIVGMRHRTVHLYWDVNVDLVHAVIVRDLPQLIAALHDSLAAWPLPEEP